MRFVACVDKNAVGRFVMRPQRLQEIAVVFGHLLNIAPVTCHGRFSAAAQPNGGVKIAKDDAAKHDFMIATQHDRPAKLSHLDQLFDHVSAVRAPIDVITQEDQLVFRSGRDGFDETAKRFCATVDIAHHVSTHVLRLLRYWIGILIHVAFRVRSWVTVQDGELIDGWIAKTDARRDG